MNKSWTEAESLYTSIYSLDIDLYLGGINKMQKETQTKNTHSPNLATILMVEKVIKEEDIMSVADLKRKLPKKVMHKTLLQILDYLQVSGKIVMGPKGIFWTYMPHKELERLIKGGTEV